MENQNGKNPRDPEAPENRELLERIATLQSEKKTLKANLKKAAKAGKAPVLEVSGSYKASYINQKTGDEETVTVSFKPGSQKTRLRDGFAVDSELLLKVANGGKLNKAQNENNPRLALIEMEEVKEWLNELAAKKYGQFIYKN